MDFLERMSDRDRERFIAAATIVRFARGEFVIRRGERGGDVYRVNEGELEIIDSRQQPAVVLSVIGRGQMVGEMGFLEEQVRTADVRATDATVCQRWDRGSLLRVLEGDPTFAAAFYRALAGFAVDRARTITTTAMTGSLAGAKTGGSESAAASAKRLAAEVRDELAAIEPQLRRDRPAAEARLQRALANLAARTEAMFGRVPWADQDAAGSEIARELHPYIMQSHLGETANDRVEGWCADGWSIAHISAHKPKGDGALGELVDAWLQELPSSKGLRERRALAAELVAESLPPTPPFRMLCVGVNSATLLNGQMSAFGRMGGEVICIEPSTDALAVADSDLSARPRTMKLKLIPDDLASFCLGRPGGRHPPQNIVILDCLLEYLPEAIAVTCLRTAVAQLPPGGVVIATSMAPASDDLLYRYLLRWPMIRRSKAALAGLMAGAGTHSIRVYEAGGAGLVAIGTRP